jgi:UDP-2,3-diacylglucosamine hydrolase
MAAPDPTLSKLGLLAGGGTLPRRLVEACRGNGRPIFVVAFEGQTDPATVVDADHVWVKLGAAARTIDALKQAGAEELVLAGSIQRPSLFALAPDWRGAQLLARIGARALGDDGLLKAVRDELETEGFRLIGADEVLREVVAGAGTFGAVVPDAQALADIAHGMEVARRLGDLDIGQAVVVQQGVVLALEAAEGTDALIARSAALRKEGPRPVLVKRAKPQQDRRLDLPTIGPDTVTRCAEAGFAGIAVQAGGSLVLDRAEIVARADAAGVFVLGVSASA